MGSLVTVHLKDLVMRDIKQHVDTNSADFKQGVEAGLNSAKDSKNWQAGNKLGQELQKLPGFARVQNRQ